MTFTLHPAANSYKWRLALAEADLTKGSFANYGLPAPTTPDPRDHSQLVSQRDGGQAAHGFERVELLFERFSEQQMTQLGKLIVDARATSGVIYMTIWTGVGYDLNPPRWIDVFGRPHRPENIAPARAVGVKGQLWYDAVRWTVMNLTVVNDPSVYTT